MMIRFTLCSAMAYRRGMKFDKDAITGLKSGLLYGLATLGLYGLLLNVNKNFIAILENSYGNVFTAIVSIVIFKEAIDRLTATSLIIISMGSALALALLGDFTEIKMALLYLSFMSLMNGLDLNLIKSVSKDGNNTYLFFKYISATVIGVLIFLVGDKSALFITFKGVVVILILTVCSYVSYNFLLKSVKTIGAVKSSIFLGLIPAVSTVMMYVTFGGKLSTMVIAPIVLLVLGTCLVPAYDSYKLYAQSKDGKTVHTSDS